MTYQKEIGISSTPKVYADWTGDSARIVLVKKGSTFWCLWGSAGKEIAGLTPVKCVTAKGNPQEIGGSFKRFREMINATKKVNIK